MDFSPDVYNKLKIYEKLLLMWQPHLNLISGSTLDTIWDRHFIDSAQLFDLIPDKDSSICDLGSGAGFPGAILAIMGCKNITLIERDHKKCSFLRSVSRETMGGFEVFEGDVKDFSHKADVITSRALAPLGKLLDLSKPLLKSSSVCLFLKGEKADLELQEIDQKITVSKIPSLTSKGGVILKLSNI